VKIYVLDILVLTIINRQSREKTGEESDADTMAEEE
jgi:hypothetical protein